MAVSREPSSSALRATLVGREGAPVELEPEEWRGLDADEDASVAALEPEPADLVEGRRRYEVVVDGWRFEVVLEPAARARLRERARRAGAEHGSRDPTVIRAQIPGRVVAVAVAPGEQVEAGQRLLSVEAMKMENDVRAPRAGTIERVAVGAGGRVELGDELVVIS